MHAHHARVFMHTQVGAAEEPAHRDGHCELRRGLGVCVGGGAPAARASGAAARRHLYCEKIF